MTDWKDLTSRAKAQGWRIEQGRRHLKWYAPDGKGMVVSSLSCSDSRGIKNHLSLLRRHGFSDS